MKYVAYETHLILEDRNRDRMARGEKHFLDKTVIFVPR